MRNFLTNHLSFRGNKQHAKGLKSCSTWRHRTRRSTTTSCIILLTLVVGNLVLIHFSIMFFFFFSKNKFYDVVQILFEGTKNVIDACIEQKVKILIYTSSPSVVFDGVHGILNGDESLPYPPMVLKPESPFSIFINFCVTFFFL